MYSDKSEYVFISSSKLMADIPIYGKECDLDVISESIRDIYEEEKTEFREVIIRATYGYS